MKSLAALLMLAACGCGGSSPGAERDPPTGVAVACALGGTAAFANDCTVQKTMRDGRAVLTLIAPDGGFRRLEARGDGGGIDTADGASHVRVTPGPAGRVAVQVDDDHYRLPATAR